MTATRIEAEAMTLSDGLLIETNGETSNGEVVRVGTRNGSGTLETVFTGIAGVQTLTIGYFDESDGIGSYSVLIDGVEIDSWTADETDGGLLANAQSARTRTIAVDLEPGQTIAIATTGSRGEWGRVDYLDIEPTEGGGGGDGDGGSEPVNAAPLAGDDVYDAVSGTPLTVDATGGVLANDTDPDGDALSVVSYDQTGSAGGALALNIDGSFNYTPATSFVGTETFGYRVADPDGAEDGAAISVTVAGDGSGGDSGGDGSGNGGGGGSGGGSTGGPGTRIEAEDMVLSPEYMLEADADGSGGTIVRIAGRGLEGSASTTFDGAGGTYDLAIGYFDESDGVSSYRVLVDGIEVDRWSADATDGGVLASEQSARERVVTVDLDPGQTITVEGTQSRGEWARLDYLDIREPAGGSGDGGSGDGGSDGGSDGGGGGGTADEPLRILTLGDSITAGVVESRNDLVTGGYRPPLSELLALNGIEHDFVGELRQTLPDLADGEHGGYSGRTIDFLDGFDQRLVQRYDPDVVLLMAGTNDTKLDDVDTMLADMRALLLSLTGASPDMQVMVATIPPIDPAGSSASRVAKVDAFNTGLETLVAELAGEGMNVGFVDMRDLTLNEISDTDVDSGLHPTEAGYEQIAGHWADAIADHVGTAPALVSSLHVESETHANGDVATSLFQADGTLAMRSIEDVSDTRGWDLRTFEFGDAGTMERKVTVQDDGDIVTIGFHDNGERSVRTFEDVSDTRLWHTRTVEFDEDGTRTGMTTLRDDTDVVFVTYHENGERATRTFEDVSDQRDWTQRTDTFDEDGGFIERTYTWDDGTGLV